PAASREAAGMNLLPEVAEKVNRPFSEKWLETTAIVAHHFLEFSANKLVAAFSGGKDSLAVLHIVRQYYSQVAVCFNDAGVEYPETVAYVKQIAKDWNLNLVITPFYKKTFWDCVEQYGFPEKTKSHFKDRGKQQKAKCCYYLKEMPMKLAIRENGWLGMFTGTTAVESRIRMFVAQQKGMCYHVKHYNCCKINPILWWTEKEVWDYIKQEGIPYNPLYDIGAHRVGCMPCTAYLNWEEQLSKLNINMYALVKLRKDGQYT
ncbi:unnamed protein product, partial [marine sediment metagenome]